MVAATRQVPALSACYRVHPESDWQGGLTWWAHHQSCPLVKEADCCVVSGVADRLAPGWPQSLAQSVAHVCGGAGEFVLSETAWGCRSCLWARQPDPSLVQSSPIAGRLCGSLPRCLAFSLVLA